MRSLKMVVLSLVVILGFAVSAQAAPTWGGGAVDKVQFNEDGNLVVLVDTGSSTKFLLVPASNANGKVYLSILLTAQSLGRPVTFQYETSTGEIMKLSLEAQ